MENIHLQDWRRLSHLLVMFVLVLWPGAKSGSASELPITPSDNTLEHSRFVEIKTGVNRTNLAWEPDAENILERMRSLGFKRVRVSFVPPYDGSIKTLQQASALGFDILTMIPLSASPLYNSSTTLRAGNGKIRSVRRLSEINVDLYSKVFNDLIKKLDNLSVNIDAFEIGNEINWADFNGDFPILTSDNQIPRSFRVSELNASSAGIAIAEGLRKYLQIMRLSKSILQLSEINKKSQLITAGTFDVETPWLALSGGSALRGKDFLQFLVSQKVPLVADGFGTHFYPTDLEVTTDKFKDRINEVCDGSRQIFKAGCWITEWNVARSTPPDERCGAAVTTQDDEAFDKLASFIERGVERDVIHRSYVFSFDQEKGYALFRCGRPTHALEFIRSQ